MLKVKDIMSRQVVVLPADIPPNEAARYLSRDGISGAPVRNADGELVGVVSQADLVNLELGGRIRRPTVADFMSANVLSVYEEDAALSAVGCMAEHDVHRVVVLDAEGEVAGIVTSLDVVKAIDRGLSFAQP